MSKFYSNKKNTNLGYFFEFLINFLKALPTSFLRYFVVVSFILLSLGGYILTDTVYRWVVFLLATFGLWKIFDLLDLLFESFVDRVTKKNNRL